MLQWIILALLSVGLAVALATIKLISRGTYGH